jgi:hypothetical protein
MTLNDVLAGHPTHSSNSTQGACARCGRVEALGWSPIGMACAPCARDVHHASVELAQLDHDIRPARSSVPFWFIALAIKFIVLAIVVASHA